LNKDVEDSLPNSQEASEANLGLSSPTLLVNVTSGEVEEAETSLAQPLPDNTQVRDLKAYDGEILCVEGGQRYKMGPVVAQGGMGIVREALDLNCRRPVAIKILPQDRPIQPEEHERFIEEAQITSQLEHPNIVPVHEVGIDTNRNVFYSMKYVKGITLTGVLMGIRKGDADIIEQYPLSRLLNIFQKVCDAIAFAHSRDVVHCDLKPDNIMICDFGEVLVMDWGLARRVGSKYAGFAAKKKSEEQSPSISAEEIFKRDTALVPPTDSLGAVTRTTTGRIMGTPGFMAPERIWSEATVDVRSDIYSLGATLYSILTLRAPIAGKDMRVVLQRILDGDIRPPVSFNDDPTGNSEGTASSRRIDLSHCPENKVPAALSEVAMKALSTDPADRYASVKEFQQEVEAYQNGLIWHLVVDDDFTSEKFLENWEVIGGQYSIKDGELKLSGGEPQILLLKRDLPGDIRIEFECHQESAYLNDVSCFMSAVRSSNRKEIPSSGYEFKYGAYDNSLNLLMRSDRRIWSESASPLVRSQRYRVRAERVGSRLRLVVNNQEIFRVTDRDPLSGPDRTAVGMVGWIADTRYRHIRVYCLGTPWKSDLLDMAERQTHKGNYDLSMALFQEVMDSFPDAARLARAKRGYETAHRRAALTKNLPEWKARLEAAWPGRAFQLRMDNDGLTLEISKCDIEDLSPIAELPLTTLYCAHNRISSLEPLRGMALGTLNCTGNPVTSLEPLRGMPLSTLLCECCSVSSLEPLRGMQLTLLAAGGNRIDSLEPLRGMPLTLLAIWNNNIDDLSPLRGMPLTAFYCNSNRLTTLEPLTGMPLVTLNCGGNQLASLEPLRGMPLTTMHCGANKITSLEPLRGMNLSILSFPDNQITTLQPLKGMTLGSLNCGRNLLTGVVPFAATPPDDFGFDCETIPTRELEWLHEKWSHDFRYANHARNVKVLLALRSNDLTRLRALASEFKGKRYLFIPRFLRWEEAKAFCEKLGGHLATIGSEEENAFLTSMCKSGCWAWMGLVTKENGHEWITGEPVTYLNFVDKLQECKHGPKIFSGRWARDDVANASNIFIIKWES
jgi:serine/threonine protein kinase/Leucine-rich repeat (LRR) protein